MQNFNGTTKKTLSAIVHMVKAVDPDIELSWELEWANNRKNTKSDDKTAMEIEHEIAWAGKKGSFNEIKVCDMALTVNKHGEMRKLYIRVQDEGSEGSGDGSTSSYPMIISLDTDNIGALMLWVYNNACV